MEMPDKESPRVFTQINLTPDAFPPDITLNARIGWHSRFSQIIFDDPPFLVLQTIPVFPGCGDDLAKLCIVWDVLGLIDSVRRPGAYQLLTCECGYAPDVDLEEMVHVSHPDAETILWELDIPGLLPALDEAFQLTQEGFVRLIFRRAEYETDIRTMLRELQEMGNSPIAVGDLSPDSLSLDHLRMKYPHLEKIRAEEFQPRYKGLELETLLEQDAAAPWPKEAIWPPGTLVEFGFFAWHDSHELLRINGELSGALWPEHYFTRWELLMAFKGWLSHTRRAFALEKQYRLPKGIGRSEFVLLSEEKRMSCHAAGHRLAALMQASLDEGVTAPGVTVRYCECRIYAVTELRS